MTRNTVFSFSLALSMIAAMAACEQTSKDGAKKKTKSAGMAAADGHLGKAFQVKEVTDLEAIAKDPKKYEGKTVRVAGLVTAHCHHRRAWFAIRKSADSKLVLRIQTAPAFLVPKNVKHNQTQGEAEGVVALKTVPEKYAKHMAKEHGLFGGQPDKVNGPQVVGMIKATGATLK